MHIRVRRRQGLAGLEFRVNSSISRFARCVASLVCAVWCVWCFGVSCPSIIARHHPPFFAVLVVVACPVDYYSNRVSDYTNLLATLTSPHALFEPYTAGSVITITDINTTTIALIHIP